MYKRDFAIVILAVCALYVSLQNEGTFSFKKAWYYPFEDYEGLLDTPDPLPPPLVADLNGDGKPEVIAAAPDGTLLVLAPRRFGDGFAAAQRLSEIHLDHDKAWDDEDEEGEKEEVIAALGSGYLLPPPRELVRAPRKQVVVVVTSALRVLCYDHNLRKLWEQDLKAHFPPHGSIREIAVTVTDAAVSKGDKGLVVVGASVVPLTLADRLERDDALEEEEDWEELERSHSRGLKAVGMGAGKHGSGGAKFGVEREDTSEAGRHFSYFAFEGGRGQLRWKHEAEDFIKDLGASREELVAAHSYRLRAEQAEGRHYGELSCRDYRDSVLAVLPHTWASKLDTRFQLAHFERQREGKGAQKEQLSKLGAAKGRAQPNGGGGGGGHGGQRSLMAMAAEAAGDNLVTDVLASVIRGAMHGGSSKARARQKQGSEGPNVLVAHVEEGIEAVHLYSGRTVCRLHLPSPGLNADVNGDGVPDHVEAVGGDPAELETLSHTGHAGAATFCTLVAMSGVPPTQPLFNGTICRSLRAGGLGRAPDLSEVEVAQPILLPLPGKHGRYRVGQVGQKGVVVALNSRGDLTAYEGDSGEMLWQAAAGASWSGYRLDEDSVGVAPVTLQAMALRTGAIPTVILAAGSWAGSIVSEHGRVLDTLDLPDVPTQPLVLLDFNFDGYNDIVLVGREGLYGWAQVRRPGAVPFSALVGGLVVILVAVFVTQQGFMQGGGGSARRKGRSTDRID